MRESLGAFADRNRASGVMALAAADADPSHWDALVRHYAAQERRQSSDSAAGDHARGREIALRGLPERKVPACLGCHEAAGRNPMYPALSGQHATYLEAQLRLFAAGIRGGTQYRHLMSTVARNLTPQDMRDLAAYFSARPAAP
jgi:cytochrome c553